MRGQHRLADHVPGDHVFAIRGPRGLANQTGERCGGSKDPNSAAEEQESCRQDGYDQHADEDINACRAAGAA